MSCQSWHLTRQIASVECCPFCSQSMYTDVTSMKSKTEQRGQTATTATPLLATLLNWSCAAHKCAVQAELEKVLFNFSGLGKKKYFSLSPPPTKFSVCTVILSMRIDAPKCWSLSNIHPYWDFRAECQTCIGKYLLPHPPAVHHKLCRNQTRNTREQCDRSLSTGAHPASYQQVPLQSAVSRRLLD